MKRKLILQLALPLLGLCLLFLLLMLEPKYARQQPELLEVSVILRQSELTIFSTALQGIEQAAADLNVELRILAPGEDNSAGDQAQLLVREVEGGADAVLLFPADRRTLAQAVGSAAGRISLVTLETDMRDQGAVAWVGTDNAALGRTLAQAAASGVPEGGTVLLLDSAPGDNAVRERLEAAADVLEQAGRQVRLCRPDGERTLSAALREELALPVGAVLAFEAAALEQAAEMARGEPGFPLLYGSGSTAAIAAGLEDSRIAAILAQNEFSAGYLAVEAAARDARGQEVKPVEPMPFVSVRQENMYDGDNQKLLFPVT